MVDALVLGLYSMVVAEERLLISLLSKGLACHVFYFNQIADCMVHLLLIDVLNSNCFTFYCIIVIQKKQKKEEKESGKLESLERGFRMDT